MSSLPVRIREACECAYEAITDALRDDELPPGKPVPVRQIAEDLRHDAASVRDACERLTEEGSLIRGSSGTYYAWCTDENVIAGLYDCNRALLTAALDHTDIADPDGVGELSVIRQFHEKLIHWALTDPSLASTTGALFFTIAAHAGNENVMELIRCANERLYHLRILECRYFGDTANELIRCCALLLDGRQDDLQEAIIRYHDRRRRLVPDLYGMIAAQ